jgi:hypothetical protein
MPRVAPGENALVGAWWLNANAAARGRLVVAWRMRDGERKAEENSLAVGLDGAVGIYQGNAIADFSRGAGRKAMERGCESLSKRKFVSPNLSALNSSTITRV